VDITASCKAYESERVKIEIGRHDDIAFLRRLAAKHTPLVTIDDGSHFWTHQVDLFETLFPSVQPGGFYICEDLQVCYGPAAERYGDLSRPTSASYFAKLAERMLGERPGRHTAPLDRYLLSWIDGIHFAHGAVIVRKRLREQYPLEAHPRAQIGAEQRPAAPVKPPPRAS
jgi:hypothetical protein